MAGQRIFKTAETGATLSDAAFQAARDRLRLDLVELQQACRQQGFPIVVVLSGVQGAGVVDTANLLNTWMDPRWIQTHAFDAPSDEERERPLFWRYWRSLPADGNIGLYLDGWYGGAVTGHVRGHLSAQDFTARLQRIRAFETTLAKEGALIVKLWLHLGKAAQRHRVDVHRADSVFGFRSSDNSWPQPAPYDRYVAAMAKAIDATHTARAPWYLVEGTDDNHRRARVLTLLRKAMTAHCKHAHKKAKAVAKALKHERKAAPKDKKPHKRSRGRLAGVDLSQRMSDAAYAKAFKASQQRLYDAQKAARTAGISTVIAFEGWDAAGKGGAIRRLTYALSARNYQVVPIAAPNDEERAHHYLWRFWRHLGRDGHVRLFDRSWYGRVLVERVEHLIPKEAWTRAYGEINDFEAQIVAHGSVLLKFWLHIDPKEQAKRFRERCETPYKRWKITADDWRNRAKWNRYEDAANDMIARTSTKAAPWQLVPAEDKHVARIMILDTVIKALEDAIRHKTRQKRRNFR